MYELVRSCILLFYVRMMIIFNIITFFCHTKQSSSNRQNTLNVHYIIDDNIWHTKIGFGNGRLDIIIANEIETMDSSTTVNHNNCTWSILIQKIRIILSADNLT